MKTNKMLNNNVCEPVPPKNAEDIAISALKALLTGENLNRKTVHQYGICAENASLHSSISLLRNIRYIPIESRRSSDGTSDYYMMPEEIMRYRDPELRVQQEGEMRDLVTKKRVKKMSEIFFKLVTWLTEDPNLLRYLPKKICQTIKDFNALINIQRK